MKALFKVRFSVHFHSFPLLRGDKKNKNSQSINSNMTSTNWKNVNNWHWVEKNCLPWAIDHLKSNLTGIEYIHESNGTKVSVTEVSSVTGDADLNQRKGKLITVFDVAITLLWNGIT